MRARKTEPWVVLYVLERAAGDDSLPVWGAIIKGVQHLRAVLADDATATEDLNVRDNVRCAPSVALPSTV